MKITTSQDAGSFLRKTQVPLESNEACNSLILGICQRLAAHREKANTTIYLKTVEEEKSVVIAAMMTPPHNLVLAEFEGNVMAAASELAGNLYAEGGKIPGVFGPGRAPQYFAERWAEINRCDFNRVRKQIVYTLRQVAKVALPKGELRIAAESDSELLAGWWYAFQQKFYDEVNEKDALNATNNRIGQKNLYIWEDGQPVSMAIKTRPTRNGISISMVYTPPEFRGNGYATACVSALSQLLLNQGYKFCALFADAANTPANRLYRKIGYMPVCEYNEYRFQ
jgi:predicted GNAT family acetyltransferase